MTNNNKLPMQNYLDTVKKVHLVGIGGAGMAGIAQILLDKGFIVSGSDVEATPVTASLKKRGAKVTIGHDKNNLAMVDLIVVSSAILADNPEIIAAREQAIPVLHRGEMLAQLMSCGHGIAVAGTHGKTTTTSLLATLLMTADLSPTIVVGGCLASIGGNAIHGSGKWFVAEADESDASLLHLRPKIAIITSINRDHMDTYAGSFAKVKQTFIDFIHNLPEDGLAILCLEDPAVRELLPHLKRRVITYGLDSSQDIYAKNIRQLGAQTKFSLCRSGNKELQLTLDLPGEHNVLNALAAIAVATELGVSDADIATGLSQFAGVGRRFQVHGHYPAKDLILVEDYGHHPHELAMTISAARKAWPKRRLVMAYQPHRYTRTRDLFDDFVRVLSQVDELLLLDIYAASEVKCDKVNSQVLSDAINKYGKITPIYVGANSNLSKELQQLLQSGDLLLLQGAGDIGKLAIDYAACEMQLEQLVGS